MPIRGASAGAGGAGRCGEVRLVRRVQGGGAGCEGSDDMVLNSSTECSIRGNKACVVPMRPPGASPPLRRPTHDCGDGATPTISSIRSPAPGMNGRKSSAMTRTASAATYNAASSSARLAASFASDHGSRVTIYRFVAPITSHVSRNAWLNWNDSTQVRTRLDEPVERRAQRRFRLAREHCGLRARDDAVAVPVNHRRGPADEVAQIVGQVGVVPAQDGLVGEIGVLAEHHLAHHEISEPVDAEQADIVRRPDDVAERLGHLGAVHEPPAVAHEPARDVEACRHQECRPVDAVLADDFLADEMHVGRPVFVERARVDDAPKPTAVM